VQAAAPWVTVSPTSGTNNVALTLTFQTSGLAAQAQPYTTSFSVVSGNQSVTVNVAVTIVAVTPPPPPTLTITCPANITVASPDGSPVVVTYTVTTSGGNPPVNLTVTPQSGSSFAVGPATTVQANAQSQDGQTKSCSFTVTVTAPSSNWTFCAAENQFCAFSGTKQVRYGANNTFFVQTLTGGTQCSNAVFGDPIPGVVKHCDVNSTVQVGGIGPQTAITCPAGAADILPGQAIQLIINANVAGTTFCLRAGTHPLTSSLRPKTGNTFVGEFGAIIDGTGWTTTERTQAAFRVYDDPNNPNDPNDPISDVTIRNLVIRNMPQWGIYAEWGINASQQLANHWTIDHNEIASNKWGLLFGPNFTVTNNYIHHNVGNSSSSIPDDRGGGYLGDSANNTTFDNNEIAYNGREQKVGRSSNVKFTNNFVHHNVGDGIWYDSNPNAAALIDNNRVEDNGRNGIFFEASIGATISNNQVRRHTNWDGVFISMSQNAQIFNNTIEGNFGGIDFYLNCDALSPVDDIKNNTAHDNTVVPGTLTDTYASGFFSTFTCTSTQLAPYLSGSKNLIFSHNTYRVPSLSFTRYFSWGGGGYKDWGQWQAVPQDATGTITTP